MFAQASRLIFGEDKHAAKLTFRTTFLPRLAEETVSTDDANWAQLWLVFDSAADVVTLLPVVAIRSILASYPENIATLVRTLCAHLFSLLQDPDFPNVVLPASSPYAGGPASYITRRTSLAGNLPRAPNLAREALNCVRVLTRVLPCIFERAGLGPPASGALLREEEPETPRDELALEPDRFEEEMLWTKERRRKVLTGQNGHTDHFVINEDDDEDAEGDESTTLSQDSGFVDLAPLGERLMALAIDMLFVAGFTLPEQVAQEDPDHRRVAYVIWESGIGSATSVHASAEQETNRTEVLRLLLVLLSRSMYVPPASAEDPHLSNGGDASTSSAHPHHIATSNRFLHLLRHWPVRRMALSLLCSLLNTAISVSGSLTAGSAVQSISTAAASVPLVGSVIGNRLPTGLSGPVAGLLGRNVSENKKELGLLSFLVLDIILTEITPDPDNIFRHYLSKLHRPADFTFLCDGLVELIVTAADARSTVEQQGTKEPAPGLVEGLVLLWRLIESNTKFFSTLLQSPQVPPKLLCALMVICLEQKDDPSSLGLLRLCAFVLQTLSAERAFGSQLGASLETTGVRSAARGKWAVPGTISDFLVVSIYNLIFTTKGALSSLYPCLTGILVNCSPYLKKLSVVASTRLMQVFLAFSAPIFLLAEDDNPRLCYNLLELFNNVIQYQLSDNPHLIYAMIRSHHRFEELASFTLQSAVAEIRKARADREPVAMHKTLSATSLAATPPLSSPTALEHPDDPFPKRSEKARGKMRENSLDRDEMDPGFPGPYTSRTGFTPSAAWVASWREALPLDAILVMLSELKPKVESLCSVASPSTNQAALDFLRSATLLGLLPQPAALRPRRFVPNIHASRWLLSIIWAAAYVRERGAFGGTRVALFSVQQGTGAPRDIVTEAVSNLANNMANVAGALQRRASGGVPSRASLAMSQRVASEEMRRGGSTTV